MSETKYDGYFTCRTLLENIKFYTSEKKGSESYHILKDLFETDRCSSYYDFSPEKLIVEKALENEQYQLSKTSSSTRLPFNSSSLKTRLIKNQLNESERRILEKVYLDYKKMISSSAKELLFNMNKNTNR